MAQESTGSEQTRGAAVWILVEKEEPYEEMTSLKRKMPPLRGEGATCLVLRCTHSRYENEMTPQQTEAEKP